MLFRSPPRIPLADPRPAMAATGKCKQLASDPPGGSRSGSKRRSGGSGAGLSSFYKPAAKRRRRTGVLRFFDGGDESEEDFHEDDGTDRSDFLEANEAFLPSRWWPRARIGWLGF